MKSFYLASLKITCLRSFLSYFLSSSRPVVFLLFFTVQYISELSELFNLIISRFLLAMDESF
ncbi:hypothetical protein BN1224_CV14_A_02590 [Chlamydia pneumoniae]|uniref:Uncharacterized protein n=1 Tax=Chlamydia pneumoniae TaxID=83558 RepID=A0A0F7WM12_CHLPN|nr:hypothetical protein BN1224_Wien1_A_02570 [Chlamydia pneumoniae]CRI35613.1 hypothetical protein BN1224_CM1_A_02600 [Chlamydia pneumoniae]CRI36740.1 hypothetical protein BN1224_CV14_A_02590 [Chlamydia pneumoniae]CRI37863.1 hypothetical protein BN1224_CV15_B_01860 [Chlamydia pneumoniae]CRI38998.1 hypothetical protein BN1224_CWL011_A_02620 [Chlamydia pneumoniae]